MIIDAYYMLMVEGSCMSTVYDVGTCAVCRSVIWLQSRHNQRDGLINISSDLSILHTTRMESRLFLLHMHSRGVKHMEPVCHCNVTTSVR